MRLPKIKRSKTISKKITKQLENVTKAGTAALLPGATSQNPRFTQAKNYAYFGKKGEDQFRLDVAADRATVDAAKQAATTAGTPVPPNIVALDAQTTKLENFLAANKETADLNTLLSKIKELQKFVNEL